MKFNKLLFAATSLLISASSQAWQTAPQSAPQQLVDKDHHHGIPHRKKIDHKAPIAIVKHYEKIRESQTQHHSKHQPKHQSKLLTNHQKISSSQALGICNVNAFATTNSSTLINEIKTQGASCVNELFGASSSTQLYAFDSNNMYAVANHTASLASGYQGNGDPDLEALYLYLRAGYYAEFYNNNITFISWVHPAVKGAIDAFVNNANFYNNNDNHGKVLQEVIIAMDSTENQDQYLYVVREWLSRWDQSYATSWNMRSAVNGIFTILFRGQWNNNFKTAIASDTTLVNHLRSFTMASWMINSESEYMIANAGRELGRLKLYTGGAIQSSVDAGLNSIFSTYQMYGYGDAVWLGAADTANYHGNCADYGICGFGAQIEAQALSQSYTCSPTIKIRSQNLTPTQQSSACSTMGAEETYFHSKLQTGNTPIAGDKNTQLQVNIFDKDTDYQKYAAAIFGINTNNGGMYLEGDPAVAGNIPNFVAYEASYAKPDHYVWNLEHEYVHYLDGRFNLAGDFNAPTAPVVWWAEGVAEYVANQDNIKQAAYDTIHDGSTYGLSTIFATTYDGFDQDRIYSWGYLAVRFMFERHFSEVAAMRNETRAGNWSAYQSRINTWASNYSNEFTSWLQTVKLGTTNPPNNDMPIAVINGPYVTDEGISTSFSSNGSYDPDGSISSYQWNFGDGGTSSQANPSYRYSRAGSYTATLTVTDNKGATTSASASVTINGGTNPPSGEITNGGSKTNLSANTGETTSNYFINVPTDATNLVIGISGGSGDADLFVKQGSTPTASNFDCRPYIGGNNETCTIANPTPGQWHMNINAYSSFTGVTLSASFDVGQTTPNEPPVVNINGPYTGDEGQAIRFSSSGSYDPNGSIATYYWDFGDGNASRDANPTHTYNTADVYHVTLSITDDAGLTETATTTASITGNTPPTTTLPDMCAVQGPQASGELLDGTAICLGNTSPAWFHVGEVNEYTSIAISTAHGSGDLAIEFSNSSWPNGANHHGASNNAGNNECIYLTNLSEYWGYIKVSGDSNGASIVVDFDSQGCR